MAHERTEATDPGMCAVLTNSSAILVAHDVNLSIFKPVWLLRHKILTEEELGDETLVSPVVVRIPAPRFELLVLPDRVQLRPDLGSPAAQDDLLRVLGGIVSILPHTPFTAIGLNFEYARKCPRSAKFAEWHRPKFAAPYALQMVPGSHPAARFGAYFSFDVMDMRLKADIKPGRVDKPAPSLADQLTPEQEVMQAKFNFHRDLVQPPEVGEILTVLGRWNSAAALAKRIVNEDEDRRTPT